MISDIEWFWVAAWLLLVLSIPMNAVRKHGFKKTIDAVANSPIDSLGSLLLLVGMVAFFLWLLSSGRTPVWPTLAIIPGFVCVAIGKRRG